MKKFNTYKTLNLPQIAEQIATFWKDKNVFEKSVSDKDKGNPFVFFEGPPSANGMPGIHHVMARTIKDIFCRYKTQKGFRVERKAGWDTHGLPVELSVEKELGITKEDIGQKISIEEYNKKCRETVMRYTDHWNNLTDKMGYWVDMQNPYITYKNKYIESVWWLLKRLYDKQLLYKGYTIQPYSPAAGTGLSSHELNQPGCYKDVKDTTVVAQFLLRSSPQKETLFGKQDVHMLAWTTTPWTLPSNTALTIGEKIDYVLIETFNAYTHKKIRVVLAENLIAKHFSGEPTNDLSGYQNNGKNIPYKIVSTHKGNDLVGLTYHPLMDVAKPFETPEKAFVVIAGDFVTTEDGTGIVHTAPTFGADDALVAKKAGVPPMLIKDENGDLVPLVDTTGKFREGLGFLSGKFVKNEYYEKDKAPEKSVDVQIAIHLKEENKAFKVEKYAHNYPHCWRTDKPVLYYPLDSWFVKTTAVKDKLIANNKKINWKPASTGTGRFGNWLENLQDWNLSRSRYWGIPIPIWSSEDRSEQLCVGSLKELYGLCVYSVSVGGMDKNPLEGFTPEDFSEDNYDKIDLHRPYVDDIVLVSKSGKKLYRETDLIDVWFDSGAMPYAQWHYPFENKEKIENALGYPADFIAEGVDQTRGWFFTLHAIATMCFDSVAYKNVVSNGLVLDKNGQKMSKRLGNAADPFETIAKYGPDATRFYMISNAQPWDNLKFDLEGIEEVQKKFFRALYNSYAFFALYANVDQFDFDTHKNEAEFSELDRWVLSKLNSLVALVDEQYTNYEPTRAAREISEFVVAHLSNWYVRLSRKRFWIGAFTADKKAAYTTLHTCLLTISKLVAPIAPFYSDQLYQDLTGSHTSVHLVDFPESISSLIDKTLEQKMDQAQKICSLALSIRKKEKIKVRQPLEKLIFVAQHKTQQEQVEAIKDLILSEINVKSITYADASDPIFKKTSKANFKTLGKKCGKYMKQVAEKITNLSSEEILALEKGELYSVSCEDQSFDISLEDVILQTSDAEGLKIASEGSISVALDVAISEDLKNEGLARELVNRIQNLRKEKGLEVTDKIEVSLLSNPELDLAITQNKTYICKETLCAQLTIDSSINTPNTSIEIEAGIQTHIWLSKHN